MQFFEAILLPLLAGYVFLSRCNYFVFSYKLSSGYHSFFEAALWGCFFLLLGRSAGNFLFPSVYQHWQPVANWWLSTRPSFLPASGILSIAFGYLASLICNLAYWKSKARAQLFRENPIQSQLYSSGKNSQLVSITLDSRKVYVGLVVAIDDNPSKGRSILIVPYYSGYRDFDQLKLKLTNGYEDIALIITRKSKYKFTKKDTEITERSLEELNQMRADKEKYCIAIDFDKIESVGPWNSVNPQVINEDIPIYTANYQQEWQPTIYPNLDINDVTAI